MFGPTQDDPREFSAGPAEPRIPPTRTFKVRRLNTVLDKWGDEEEVVEELVIDAHEVSYNSTNVLIFTVYRNDPAFGPGAFTVRAFNGWIDYEEVRTSPLALGVN
jgi:hypothetical protein